MARKRIVHVAAGRSHVGLLSLARRIPRRAIVTLLDDLATGPLVPIARPEDWWALRRQHWRALSGDQDIDDRPFALNESALLDASRIVLWVEDDVSEQLLLAWLPSYLAARDLDTSFLRFAGLPRPRRLAPLRRRVEGGPESLRWPGASELAWLAEAWVAISANEPLALAEFLERRNPVLPRLSRALQHLVGRYPDEKSGLTIHDEVLLENVRQRGPSVAGVIAYSIGRLWDSGDHVGDGVLFSRLRKLAAAHYPAVQLTGNCEQIRGTQVTITPDGERFLDGKQNLVERNGIDEWVAGVHLDSTIGRVWFRAGSSLKS